MTQITVNGNTYSDDGSTPKDMKNGGFRQHQLPMISDSIVEMQTRLDATVDQVELAEQAAAAAALAASTAVSGPGSNGTSTNTLTVAMGVQSLTIQAGKTLSVGMPCTIASTASPRNWMHGSIDSYNATTGALVVYVTNLGLVTPGVYPTLSQWTISLSGPAAPTGVLNEQKGVPIASAATIDLSAATGNYLHLTGSTTVTAVTLAQGAEREIVLDGTPLFVNSANLIIPTGTNVRGRAGDVIRFRGEGGGVVKITSWQGQPISSAPLPSFRVAETRTLSGKFTMLRSGWLRITLQGAQGSGGAVLGRTGTHNIAASGSATGGQSVKTVWAEAGDEFNYVLAAGGAAVTAGTLGTAVNGNPGNNSTITGPNGLSMTANGGEGGKAAIATSGQAVAAGAVGGTASGGDLNFTGGGSGIATSGNTLSSAAATGGGACPWRGPGNSSGAATAANTQYAMAATGGAGVGGGSGTATGTNALSAGAGSAGPSPASTVSSAAAGAVPGPAEIAQSGCLVLNGAGSVVSSSGGAITPAGSGAGGGAASYPGLSTASGFVSGGQGGLLGGSGASVGYGDNAGVVSVSGGQLQTGGVGGAAMLATNSGSAQAAAGSGAFVIFEYN